MPKPAVSEFTDVRKRRHRRRHAEADESRGRRRRVRADERGDHLDGVRAEVGRRCPNATKRANAGFNWSACMHCASSAVPTLRRVACGGRARERAWGMTGHTGGEAWVIGGRAKLMQVEAVVGGLADIRYRQRVCVVLQCKAYRRHCRPQFVCNGTALASLRARARECVRACVRVRVRACVCVCVRAYVRARV